MKIYTSINRFKLHLRQWQKGIKSRSWQGMEGHKTSRRYLPSGDHICHLLPDGGIPWPSLVLHGLPIHPHLDTPPKPAPPALVTVCLVDDTLCVPTLPALARVIPPTPDGSLEESCTPVTGKYSIVLP